MCRSWISRRAWVRAWVRPMPMWWSRPLDQVVADGDHTGGVDAVAADPFMAGLDAGRGGLGAGGVGRRRGSPAEGAVWSLLVVGDAEAVQLGLQLGQSAGSGSFGEPFLEGLLEAFDAPMFVKPPRSWTCRTAGGRRRSRGRCSA